MSLFAISDFHLSFGVNKPMNIFGENWKNYEEKIIKNWNDKIKKDDLILLPGDFSWATYLEQTRADFEFLNKLPGKKLLLKGNHDYWWNSLTKMKEFLDENNFQDIEFLYNNAFKYKNYIIVGTRGWSFTDTENAEKMKNRELIRLKISIQEGLKLKEKEEKMIAIMHYPPITKNMLENNIKSEYLDILKENEIYDCIYGHLHGDSHLEAVEGNVQDVNLKLVSCDYLKCDPIKILE